MATAPAAPPASAEWSITTADFRTRSAALRGLGTDGVRVAGRDPVGELVPLDTFVSAQRPTAGETPAGPAPKFTLALAGGDRLVGQPGAVVGETLTWSEPTLGDVPVPLSRLAALGRGRDVAVPDEPPKQDVVTLANGDVVAGVFTDAKPDAVTIQADAGPTAVPVGNIVKIAFASTGGSAAPAKGFRVRLADGSTLTAAGVAIDGEAVKLTLPGKAAKTVDVKLSALTGIEQLNGPVGWLSSMTPTENVQQPYFGTGGGLTWPARFDRAVDGSPLAFAGKTYDRGIGVHAYSRLTFPVGPEWASFRTQYAIDSRRDDPRTRADVTVRVKVDGKLVHEQAHVHAGTLSDVVTADLAGAKTITLECDYGPAGDVQARLNWLQPALLRASPTTQPKN